MRFLSNPAALPPEAASCLQQAAEKRCPDRYLYVGCSTRAGDARQCGDLNLNMAVFTFGKTTAAVFHGGCLIYKALLVIAGSVTALDNRKKFLDNLAFLIQYGISLPRDTTRQPQYM